jgi:2-oxoglutarate dehydrogenase E2 component (dihydrolipoamide succinyltransferase)
MDNLLEMAIEIKIPSPGESITQVQISKWLVKDGEQVDKDQEIVEIDSDKATFPLVAPEEGIVRIQIQEGEIVPVGRIVATIETGTVTKKKNNAIPSPEPVKDAKASPAVETKGFQERLPQTKLHMTPLAEKVATGNKVTREDIASLNGEKRITRKDIEALLKSRKAGVVAINTGGNRHEERKKLSMLRLKIAQRLVAVKNETAMLTTFNEISMRAWMNIKTEFNAAFREKFGINLGLMSFFTKAVTLALQEYPQVNSMIEGDELIIPNYMDIGIAVSAPKGLVVPVIRNAEQLRLAELEIRIKDMALKARENRITIEDMQGGTFSISNGGVFGSLMSTPILNPPQSAILGMHKIMDRPIVVDGKIEIHPMMYVALSYDHRVIDGRESVSFLIKVKEYIEDPGKMLLMGESPIRLLLDL